MKRKKIYLRITALLAVDSLLTLFLINNVRQLYYKDLGLSVTFSGYLILLYQLTKLVFETPTGFVGDKYGKKISVSIGVVFLIFSALLMFGGVLPLLFAAAALYGIGYTFISGSLDAMIYESLSGLSDRRVKMVLVINRNLYYLSYAVGVYLASLILKHLNYDAVIAVTSLIFATALIVLLTVREEHGGANWVAAAKNITFKGNTKRIFQNRFLMGMFFADLGYTFVDIPFDYFALVYLTEAGYTVVEASIIMAVSIAAKPFSGMLGLAISKRGEILMVKYSSLLAVLLFIPIFTVSNGIAIVLFILLKSAVFSLVGPSKNLIKHKLVEDSYRATALSFSSLFMAGGSIFSVFLFTQISERSSIPFAMAILIALSSTALLINGAFALKGLEVRLSSSLSPQDGS